MTDTEKKIKDVTIELLLKEGKFGVSLQEIAKKSKISRTVIHYYFSSKDRSSSIKLLRNFKSHIFYNKALNLVLYRDFLLKNVYICLTSSIFNS